MRHTRPNTRGLLALLALALLEPASRGRAAATETRVGERSWFAERRMGFPARDTTFRARLSSSRAAALTQSEPSCLTFASALSLDLPGGPRSLALADFDRDGKPDLVVADVNANDVSVLLGNGHGAFAQAVDYATGIPCTDSSFNRFDNSPSSVVVGDLNGDGKPDIAAANSGCGTVGVLLGAGDGTFATAVDYDAGGPALSLSIGDLNGDGALDLVVTNALDVTGCFPPSGTVSVLLGRGDGTFQPAVAYGTGANPRSVAIADVNRDGKPDLVVTNSAQCPGTVSVLLGRGDGTFVPKVDFGTGSYPYSVAVGDLNGDGVPDLAVANAEDVSESTPVPGTVSVLLGVGDGTFAAHVDYATGGSLPHMVGIADLNGDGKPDLAVANGHTASDLVSVLLGNGDGTFRPGPTCGAGDHPLALVLGDVNGDGRSDLAVANLSTFTVWVWLARADGTLATPSQHATGSRPLGVVAADLNRDGALDLAVANHDARTVSVLLRGGGGFAAPVEYGTGGEPVALAVGDLNGDGRPDLAVADSAGNAVSVLYGQSDSSFAAPVAYAVGLGPVAVAIGDLDGDGSADFATANAGANTVSVRLHRPDGSFAPAVDYNTAFGPSALAIGDLNRDGRADLAVANAMSGSVSVLLGSGGGAFVAGQSATISGTPVSLAIADLNGDGKPDLATVNPSFNSTVSVLPGLGDGTFAAATDYDTGHDSRSLAVGDLNGDGHLDLVTVNAEWRSYAPGTLPGTLSILFGQTGGGFLPRVDFAAGRYPYAVALGDMDGDALPDLAVANSGGNTVCVLHNTGCGSFTVGTPPPRPTRLELLPAYPNPAAGAVTVRFVLPESRRVDANVFDITGRSVGSLMRGRACAAGEQRAVWDRRSREGTALAAGLYFVKVRAGKDEAVARVVLVE